MPDRSRTHRGPRLHSSPHRAGRLGHRCVRRMSGKEGNPSVTRGLQRRVLLGIRRQLESPTGKKRGPSSHRGSVTAATAAEISNCYARRARIERPHFARIARRASPNRPRGGVNRPSGATLMPAIPLPSDSSGSLAVARGLVSRGQICRPSERRSRAPCWPASTAPQHHPDRKRHPKTPLGGPPLPRPQNTQRCHRHTSHRNHRKPTVSGNP